MPHAPSSFRIHPAVLQDIEQIKQHNPDHARRCFDAIEDWERQLRWGRVPQEQMAYLTGSERYNFYREWVGRSGYRVIYEISNDAMTALAVLPKGDDTDDLDELDQRMSQL
ncbi:type II toxin-antitoxin system RelE family toxin [Haloarcula sp. GH36]|uniref:type II toxin-antitoxin system RelE family toxin n=1 Tax=Haloarcula montana TaxID=3111776 RepID=UPI002D78EBC2|nr:hypothetical protein [Haloarcula sp. GH36]